MAVKKQLVADFPTDPDHRLQLVDFLLRRGHSLHWSRPNKAEQPYRDALAQAEQLVGQFPDVLKYRLQLVDCRRHVSWMLLDTGRPQEGDAFAHQA